MSRIVLTDKFITSPARVPTKGRRDYFDALVPGLGLNVGSSGHRSFILYSRFPGNPNPTRRRIGQYGAITLETARQMAREWIVLMMKGVDPAVDKRQKNTKVAREIRHTFDALAEAFLRQKVKGPAYCELERLAGELAKANPAMKGNAALRAAMKDPANAALVTKSESEGLVKKQAADSIIRNEMMPHWKGWPISDVTTSVCADVIRAIVDRGVPETARSTLEWLRNMFNWAMETSSFGVTANPVANLKPASMIGKKVMKDRILTDVELQAVWKACEPMGHPYGPAIKMLILTGQRLLEVGDAPWAEFDLPEKTWIITADRMKGDHGKHLVPLAPDALALIKSLPDFVGAEFAFSTDGRRPINGWSKAKARLDELSGVKDWTFHDLRRTMRSHLSALPIEEHIREIIIAHRQTGIKRVYDLYLYAEEKRRGLELWEQRLRKLLAPKTPADVIQLRTGT